MRKTIILLKSDLKNITRDFMLLMSLLAPLIIALVFKFLLPLAVNLLNRELNFDLSLHYEFIMSFIILLIPLILGMLAGFLILEERDEDLLVYFSITPLRKIGYLMYRVTAPFMASIIFSFFVLEFVNLADYDPIIIIPAVLMAALEAPMMALFMGAFAGNKVEGFALSKGSGVLFVGPIVGYLIESNWQLIAGICPPYWVSKVFLASYNGSAAYWMYTIGGLMVHGVLFLFLLERFNSKIEND